MDISRIFEIFTSMDTNNDKILSKDEVKNAPCSIFGDNIVGVNFEQFEKICKENGEKLLKLATPAVFEERNTQIPQQLPSKEEVIAQKISGFYSLDLSTQSSVNPKFDFRDREDLLKLLSFDSETFSKNHKVPPNYDPMQVIEMGKSPGQNVGQMHEMGITGKGVKIAIIDSPLNTGHSEFKNNLVHYETVSKINNQASYHGAAVTSIAVGKESGIAPDADLVYIGAQFAQKQTIYDSLEKILKINEKLSDNEKIQVVSMSAGFFDNGVETARVQELIKKLSDSGVLVLSSDIMQTQGLPFGTLEKIDPMGDPDDFSNYVGVQDGMTSDFENQERTLYVNAGDRTVAAAIDNKSFRHDSASSTSWTLPYIAGVYACAKQVNPKITKEEFWDKAAKTGVPAFDKSHTRIGTIIDTYALMKSLSEE